MDFKYNYANRHLLIRLFAVLNKFDIPEHTVLYPFSNGLSYGHYEIANDGKLRISFSGETKY